MDSLRVYLREKKKLAKKKKMSTIIISVKCLRSREKKKTIRIINSQTAHKTLCNDVIKSWKLIQSPISMMQTFYQTPPIIIIIFTMHTQSESLSLCNVYNIFVYKAYEEHFFLVGPLLLDGTHTYTTIQNWLRISHA